MAKNARTYLKRIANVGFLRFIFGLVKYFMDSKWSPDLGIRKIIFDRSIFVQQYAKLLSSRFPDSKKLEIGPYMSPLLEAETSDYFDVLSTEELVLRSKNENGPYEQVVPVNFVGPEASANYIPKRYPLIVSSHVLEHQTDLIRHLNNIFELLLPGGLYIALIPDLRFCFDHFNQPSTISQIFRAYFLEEKNHTLENYFIDRLETGHNETIQHWRNEHGIQKYISLNNKMEVVDYFETYISMITDGYVDVHAWKFTPQSFKRIVSTLEKLGFISLHLSELRATLPGNNEFWAIFQRETF